MDPIDGQDGQQPIEGGEPTQPEAADPLHNVKAEFNRKLANVSDALAQQNQQMQAMLQAIQQARASQQQPSQPGRPMKELVYDDPEAFASTIEQKAQAAAERIIEQKVQLSTATQSIISDIQTKYPEFAQPGSEAASLAVSKANSQPAHLRGTPEGAKMALLEAAAELGLVPASRRQQVKPQGEDFVVGGQTTTTRQSRQQVDPKKGIDQNTLAFAEAMGIDISDPKRLEGLKKASERKNWTKYT